MLFDKLLSGELANMGKYLGQAARMMVGLPDYATYVRHRQLVHSELPLMTEVPMSTEFPARRPSACPGSSPGAFSTG